MVERLVLVLALSAAAVVIFHGLRRMHLRQMRPVVAGSGLPALIYFHSDSCAACPAQGRVVDSMAGQWGGRLRIERIDAERDMETAARFSVFSLPTTVLIDSDGRVRQVNYGLADSRKLNRQVGQLINSEPEPADFQPQISQIYTDF